MAYGRITRLIRRRVLVKINDYSIMCGHLTPYIALDPSSEAMLSSAAFTESGDDSSQMVTVGAVRAPIGKGLLQWQYERPNPIGSGGMSSIDRSPAGDFSFAGS